MTALLALASAASFGTGDFLGGLASREADARRVTLVAKAVSLSLMPVAALIVSGLPTSSGLLAGLAAGVFSPFGLASFYAAMARGPVSVVSPLTALFVAGVPVTVAVIGGERPSVLIWLGAAVAVPAVVAMSIAGPIDARPSRITVGLALVAGLSFGATFALFGTVPDDAGLWPVAVSNVTAVLVLLVLVRGVPVSRTPPTAIAAGVFDALGNATFVLAAQMGSLVLVAVLGSLYPVASVVLARLVLHERPRPIQLAGMALALVAVILLGLG
ncbi:MAG: DMT family transporter [Actinomycetota bacterium]